MENPFVFGEIVEQRHFLDREKELRDLVRDLTDGQKLFLLSPRRFGKSSLVALALLKLEKKHVRTVNVTVSSYASYDQFLEKFAERVLRSAGSGDRVKTLVGRFLQRVRPTIGINQRSFAPKVCLLPVVDATRNRPGGPRGSRAIARLGRFSARSGPDGPIQ